MENAEKETLTAPNSIADSSPIGIIQEGVHANICALREGEQRRSTNVCSLR
jgi:hypothetical protein